MIFIYQNNEQEFRSNGIGTLAPLKCEIKEELNGMYELEMEHPYDQQTKYNRIQNDRIIKVPTPRGYQLFRIYRTLNNLKTKKAFAKHISYDYLDLPISKKIDITNATAEDVCNFLKEQTKFLPLSNFETDLQGTAERFKSEITSIMKIITNIAEGQNSILQSFGGEILRDNYQISILQNIGEDRGFTVRYGKNLIGLEIDEDYSNYYPIVMPVGYNGLKLPEQALYSESDNARFKIKTLELYDVSTVEELRFKAWNYLQESKTPKVNIKVNFQSLEKTQEYKDFKMLQDVYLGDIVKIENTIMKFSKKATVISYTYDSLQKKYIDIELGDFVKDITNNFTNAEKSLQISQQADTTSKQILNMLNGNITIKNNNLYILIDSEKINQAQKLFKIGANGIQYTQNGINGTYKTIIDADGNIAK